MKKIFSVIAAALFLFTLPAASFGITDAMRDTVQRAMACFDRGDYQCAKKEYEALLKNKMGKKEITAVKKMLRSVYFEIVKKDVDNNRFPKSLETLCLKGIRMGKTLDMRYDEEDVAFHVWVTFYYFENGKKAEAKKYVGKLRTMRDNIKGSSEVDAAKRKWLEQVASGIGGRL